MGTTVNQQSIPPKRARSLARELVEWYRGAARDLPWRRTTDPYAIWVSEVMLQQTRVEVVVGRFERFLRRFPTIEALAGAEAAEVLAEWAGLGYYRRARSLHDAARALVESGRTALPATAAELRLLPGFGAYTAGAVASIAFGESVPAVDGNVQRVIARLVALDALVTRREGAAVVEAWARALLDGVDAGELNQALMELGATICTPRGPRCPECPWAGRCRARTLGRAEDYPRRPRRRATEEVVVSVAAVRDPRGRLLFRRRGDDERNAGLWELPSTEFRSAHEAFDPRAELLQLGERLDRSWTIGEALAQVRHTITHHRIVATAFAVDDDAADGSDDLRFVDAAAAQSLGLTAATAKLLEKLPSLRL